VSRSALADTGKNHSLLPKRGRGRLTPAGEAQYQADLSAFVDLIVEIQSRMNFKVSSRGWCYILEDHGLLKSDFDSAERTINDCRRRGMLPCGFMAEDKARSFTCIEEGVDWNTDATDQARGILDSIPGQFRYWKPRSFHEDQEYYLQILVEKIDLVTLFEPVCKKYKAPIANAKGWSSIGQREEMILRFKKYEEQGKKCVLLYCGDHDPAGLLISEVLRDNIDSLGAATGWTADNLIIDRFGLNGDFIIANGLSWIDNLETGGQTGMPLDHPDHRDHNKPYVQQYLVKWGARKCEANALVVKPEAGEKLCEAAINKYIPRSALKSYLDLISGKQIELRGEIRRLVKDGYLDSLFEGRP
jgi:hypothetical protein